jgi:8-oxo-dGTP pyrophosphatase MutT (NUDIX family)
MIKRIELIEYLQSQAAPSAYLPRTMYPLPVGLPRSQAIVRRVRRQMIRRSQRDAAVLVLLNTPEQLSSLHDISIPVFLRHDYGGAHANQVSFPGGKKEEADSDLWQTALRETREEIGLTGNPVLCGSLPPLAVPSGYLIHPFLAVHENQLELTSLEPDHREVRELFSVPFSILEKPRTMYWRRGLWPWAIPYYPARHPIWGATSLILSQLPGLLAGLELKQ